MRQGLGLHVSEIQPNPQQTVTAFPPFFPLTRCPSQAHSMALVSADSRIAELLTELHQLIKQTQVRAKWNTGYGAKLCGGGVGHVQRDHRELRCWKRGGRRESGVWLPFLLGFLSSTRSQGSFCLTAVWKTDHIQHKAPTEGVQLSDCFRNLVVQSSPRSALDLYPLAIIPLPPSPNSKKSQVFLWGKTVEGLRVSFQDLVKGQSTLEYVGLRQPRPAELTLCCPWPHISGLQIGWKQNQSPCLSPDRSPCVTSWSLPPSFR